MSDRHHVPAGAIESLPKSLQALAEDVQHIAHHQDCSLHDAMCEIMEREGRTDNEARAVLTALGSYWD